LIGLHCLRCEARQNTTKVVAGELSVLVHRAGAAPRSSPARASTANIHSESR
jgi:hypothetical protein